MPTITDVTGDVTHGQSITITGTGFGTKTTAAPLLWDNASGPASMLDLWDVAWPVGTSDPFNETQRRTPIRSVQPPHSRVGRYIAGSHAENTATTGRNVMFWKSFPHAFPVDIYQSCWMRADPAWTFSGGSNDDNFKCYRFGRTNSASTSPGAGGVNSATINYGGGNPPKSLSDTGMRYQAYGELIDTHYPGSTNLVNVMTKWTKFEVLWQVDSDGLIRIREDGRRVMNYGAASFPSGTESLDVVSFGDYCRQYNHPENFRYYTDCYLDTTFQRVILGNAPTLDASATTREMQVPSAWSDTSITVTVNRGVFADDDPVYLFVVDAANVASDGFLIEPPSVDAPPVISSATSVSVEIGATDPYQIVATNSPSSFDASPLPSGRTVNTSTGEITGTYDTVGTTQTTVSATNSFGTDQEVVTFDATQAPTTEIQEPVMIGVNANKVGSTLSVTVQQLVPAGNTIFVLLSCRGGTATTGIPTCKDNANGPNYKRDILRTNTDGSHKFALFRFSDNAELAVGKVITITISDSVVGAKAMTAFWDRGLNLFEPLDVTNSDFVDVGNQTPNSGQITTT